MKKDSEGVHHPLETTLRQTGTLSSSSDVLRTLSNERRSLARSQIDDIYHLGDQGLPISDQRKRPTREQADEIYAARKLVHPWLSRHLLNDAEVKKHPQAVEILIKINEEFDRQARQYPRQHITTLVGDSIMNVKERISSPNDLEIRNFQDIVAQQEQRDQKELNLNAIDYIESRVRNIWSGEEFKALEKQLVENDRQMVKIDEDIDNFHYVIQNWNARNLELPIAEKTYEELKKKRLFLEERKKALQPAIKRLKDVGNIQPPEELPDYEGALNDDPPPSYSNLF